MKHLQLLAILLLTLASNIPAAATFRSYELSRYHGRTQVSSNTFDMEFWSGGVLLDGTLPGYRVGIVRFPNNTEEPLFSSPEGYGLGAVYENQTLQDVGWPDGFYAIRIERTNALPLVLPMELRSPRAPMPQVLNYDQIVNWEVEKEMVVRFSPFTGASGSDRILVVLADVTENYRPIRTNYVSTRFSSVAIPANVLQRDRYYQLIVDFEKVFTVQTNAATGAVGHSFNSSFVSVYFTAKGAVAPPRITQDLSDVTVVEGMPFAIGVQATGDNLTYRWFQDGESRLYNTPSVNFAGAFPNLAGRWHVIVSNDTGSVTSRVAQVTVQSARPTILRQPVSVTLPLRESAVLSVEATGPAGIALSYQWNHNGQWLGARSPDKSMLIIGAAGLEDVGTYYVRVWGANDFFVDSESVQVDVTPPAIALSITLDGTLLPRLEFLSSPGLSYLLERSENLHIWNGWTNITGTGGVHSVVDAAPPLGTAFYRLKAVAATGASSLAGRTIYVNFGAGGSETITFASTGNSFSSDLPGAGQWNATVGATATEIELDYNAPAQFANDLMRLSLKADGSFSGTGQFGGDFVTLSGSWQFRTSP